MDLDLLQEDDANCRMVFGPIRSGQKIETPYTLLVIGDVNPGADLVAGGDVVVVGSLRGTAHAGAYDDEFMDKVIIATTMIPTQLRIGSIITKGVAESREGSAGGVEIARVDDRRVVVEPFTSRLLGKRKLI